MAEISAAMVKELREVTGLGMMECKKALEEAGGDLKKAEDLLRIKSGAKASKAASRVTAEGVIGAFIGADGKLGALVEVNCETDFVARTDDFRELAHDLAMQVAATSPVYVSAEEVLPEAWVELEREYGDRDKAAAAVVLLDQPFIKDAKLTIRDIVRDRIAKLGENIVVRRFARFEVGADQPVVAD